MSIFDALILGILQGITEFFPVSSSSHLKVAQKFLGLEHSDALLLFDLMCHLGTLVAALLFFRKDIQSLFKERDKLVLLCLAVLPLIPCYFLFRGLRQSGIPFQGFSLLLTGAFLFLAARTKERPIAIPSQWKFRDVLFIGAMQGMALIPGISRSGSTIAAACFRGWEVKEAVRFSFLLAIPTILGGNLLETAKLLSKGQIFFLPWTLYGVGFIASFILGSLGIRMMYRFISKKRLRPFAWYCLAAGVFCLWYLG